MKKDTGGEWETRTEVLPSLDAPVEAGEKVGELVYLIGGEEVGRTELITAEAIEKANHAVGWHIKFGSQIPAQLGQMFVKLLIHTAQPHTLERMLSFIPPGSNSRRRKR